MSGFDTPGDTWHSLILKYRDPLGFEGERSNLPAASEIEHRDAAQKLCDRYKERDVNRLLNRVRRQHARVIEFTATTDESLQLHAPFSLESLVWQLLTRGIQTAFESKHRLPDFLKETEKLNQQVPTFSREALRTFTHDSKVQKPLQEFFKTYMDCYLSMFSSFATCPSCQFEEQTHLTKALFLSQHAEWETALGVAEAERQRHLLSATVSSSPQGSLGELFRNQGTNAQFIYGGLLGKGTFGEVSKVTERTSGISYAQKLIRVRSRHDTRATERLEQQVINEVNIMQRLRHDHIASVSCYVRNASTFSIIMLPVADYDLRHFLEIRCIEPGFRNNDLKYLDNWFGCLISALAFAHEKEIKHEDIKPSNILIKDNRPYLADFGSAKDFSDTQISASPEYQVGGTPVYWPPENTANRGRPADIFALGCVFSEMLTVRQKRSLADYQEARHVPGLDFSYAFRQNLSGIEQWLSGLDHVNEKDSVPDLLFQTVLNMLKSAPDDRPTAKQIRKRFRYEEDLLFCQICS